MRFLQCLSSLRRDYGPSLCSDENDVVWDSLIQLLDCVLEVFRLARAGQPVRHPELLRHATQVMAHTLGAGKTDPRPPLQCFSRVEDLLKEMIYLLLTGHQLNEVTQRPRFLQMNTHKPCYIKMSCYYSISENENQCTLL